MHQHVCGSHHTGYNKCAYYIRTCSLMCAEYKPAKEEELDPMDPAAYSDTPRCILAYVHVHMYASVHV